MGGPLYPQGIGGRILTVRRAGRVGQFCVVFDQGYSGTHLTRECMIHAAAAG
ncbi:MAG: hypothetical protein NTW72_07050 [Gemmatimonadetes bacterium]|jgi:hypothetical protein|nr:hypothetical protein [Gemmatimonadota bacterium]